MRTIDCKDVIMSRSDFPPGYDPHAPLYGPQGGGGYPPPPAYGFPGGAHPQGSPAAPYPAPGPNAPPYSGPPGGYPPAPYPGQPQPGAGYGVDPVFLHLRADDVEGEGFAARNSRWDSVGVRHAFIRKVYTILASQLLLTAGITLALSYMAGAISSRYDTKSVFLALGITAVVCIVVTLFCFQTKVDVTKYQGLFCVLGIVMLVTGIITTIVLSFKYMPWLHMLYAAMGAIIYTLFLMYHTQLVIGNRKHSISPEEYVFAAITIYVDIIQIFLLLLQLIGAAKR
ncbi:hypothetical protein CRUP_015877 [Coryphaenoides rupestris]|nr:hypothetical protein CRUP_015877 [Coryphaenoides rupestris]